MIGLYLAFLGGYEWIVVLVIAMLLFGNRIPGMARSLGSGIVEFKKGLKSGSEDDDAQRIGSDTPGSVDEPKRDS